MKAYRLHSVSYAWPRILARSALAADVLAAPMEHSCSWLSEVLHPDLSCLLIQQLKCIILIAGCLVAYSQTGKFSKEPLRQPARTDQLLASFAHAAVSPAPPALPLRCTNITCLLLTCLHHLYYSCSRNLRQLGMQLQ